MKRKLFVLLLLVFLLSKMSFGTIKIDSIKTTNSTCSNNGTITVYVTSDNKFVLYSIISGPVTSPNQTNRQFSSLPQGNYTIKVTDGSSKTDTKNVTISGGYTPLNFSPIAVYPHCIGSSTGQIIGNRTPGTGSAPFTWQLIAPSPVTTALQASDTLKNLPAGIYTVRLTDACGNYSTTSISILNPKTQIKAFIDNVFKIGCDSVLLNIAVQLPIDTTGFQRLPLTFKYQTKNGIYIPPIGSPNTVLDTSNIHDQFKPFLAVKQMLPNLTYGDSMTVTVYNSCGDSSMVLNQLPPFVLKMAYSYNCDNSADAVLFYWNGFFDGLKSPITYTVSDVGANTVIENDTDISNFPNHFPITKTLAVNTPYKITATDGCGLNYQDTYIIPSPQPPAINDTINIYNGCIDSVAYMGIKTTGFSRNSMLILLSGPSISGSTKPGFEYSDTYTYPDTIFSFFGGSFGLGNLAIGAYKYKVVDGCGNLKSGSFIIQPFDVTSLEAKVSYKKDCSGHAIIYFSYSGHAQIKVVNITTGKVFANDYYGTNGNYLLIDSVLNATPGKYVITYTFFTPVGYVPINKNYKTCPTIIDTITIPENQPPAVSSSNSIKCNENINVELIPDSTKGIPPYQYAITDPQNQTTPIQNSNIFFVSRVGTYIAHIYDKCGNSSTTAITVDSLSFPPIGSIKSICNNSVKLYCEPSAFYTYYWSKGNNFRFKGDTLFFAFVSNSDTGTYTITKLVNINGCISSYQNTYYLLPPNYFVNDINICAGTKVVIGSHTYTDVGTYIDTLKTYNGCDSIVQINIRDINTILKLDTLKSCKQVFFKGNIYTSSTTIIDTLKGIGGCDSVYRKTFIVIGTDSLNITLKGCNSVVYKGTTYTLFTIVRDTLKNTQGCDSIYTIKTISIIPILTKTIDSIVLGCDSAVYRGSVYRTNAKVKDTIQSYQGCDSIYRTATINITPFTTPSVIIKGNDTICTGATASFTASAINGGNNPSYYWTIDGIGKTSQDSIFKVISLNNNDTVGCTLISNAKCLTTNTVISNVIKIAVKPFVDPAINITASNNAICVGNEIVFTATAINGGNDPAYQWKVNNGNMGTNVEIFASSLLKNGDNITCILNSNETCVTGKTAVSNSILISVSEGNCDTLFVPTAFDPINNVDSKGRILRPYSNGNTIKQVLFKVYNRFGSLVFESHDLNSGWDGSINGKIQNAGTYVWTLEYVKNSGRKQTAKGTSVLIY